MVSYLFRTKMEFPESQDSKKFVNGFQVLEWPKFFVVSSSFELGNVTGLRKDDFFFRHSNQSSFQLSPSFRDSNH